MISRAPFGAPFLLGETMAKVVTEVALGAAAIGASFALPGIGEALFLSTGWVIPAGTQAAMMGMQCGSMVGSVAQRAQPY